MRAPSETLTPKDEFLGSLDRCSSNDAFLTDFYKRFIESSDEVRHKFRHTSFDKQKRMLLKSLRLSAEATSGDPKALSDLTDRGETHNRRHLDIKPELYQLWLESLITTAQEFDGQWTESTERSWRTVLGFVIRRMTADY